MAHDHSDAVKAHGFNQMRADCSGDLLTIYVNGKKFEPVLDSDFASGNVGLIVASGDEGNVDVAFSDFRQYDRIGRCHWPIP